jgi:hypothetical protein
MGGIRTFLPSSDVGGVILLRPAPKETRRARLSGESYEACSTASSGNRLRSRIRAGRMHATDRWRLRAREWPPREVRGAGLVVNMPGNVTWIENTHRFWYRKVTRGGYEFVMVDADTLRKAPAFDHARLAAALSKATGKSYQLIKHDKDFDLLYIPGAGHGPGGAYGEHKRFDFFVRQLLGVTPPAWTKKDQKTSTADQEFEWVARCRFWGSRPRSSPTFRPPNGSSTPCRTSRARCR